MEAAVAARDWPRPRGQSIRSSGNGETHSRSAPRAASAGIRNHAGASGAASETSGGPADRSASSSTPSVGLAAIPVVDDWSDPIPIASGELDALEAFLMDQLRRFIPNRR